MKKTKIRLLSGALSAAMLISSLTFYQVPVYAASMTAGGWYETIYADITGVKDADVTAVSYSGAMDGSLKGDDLTYLVRDGENGVRIDIPGLKAGNYTLKVTAGGTDYTKENIKVYEYDRAGYAHKDAEEAGIDGVGAYKNDGTLKDNAVVVYVTDENKNTVTVPGYENGPKGIGNILNEKSTDTGSSSTKVIKELRNSGKPLVIRFIGTVVGGTEATRGEAPDTGNINGLTGYDSTVNGGTEGDNGMIARIYKGSDITFEGIGTDAVIDGWGFQAIAQKDENSGSFEFRNLTFTRTPEDAIGLEGTASDSTSVQSKAYITSPIKYCWVHNNTFNRGYCAFKGVNATDSDKKDGDGSVDFKRGYGFTMSYNHFCESHKTNLIGSGNKSIQYDVTYHHNYYENVEARQPIARHANVHIYNSYFVRNKDSLTNYEGGTTKLTFNHTMSVRAHAYVLSEGNFFEKSKNPIEAGRDEGTAWAKSYNDIFTGVEGNNDGVVVTSRETAAGSGNDNPYRSDFDTAGQFPYSYTVTDAAQAKADCIAKAGVMKADGDIDMDPEPASEIAAENMPSAAISLPYTLDVTPKYSTSAVNNVNNALLYIIGAYSDKNGGPKVKGDVIFFKVAQEAVVTVKTSSAAKMGMDLVAENGTTLGSVAGSGASMEVRVPAGTYFVRTSPTDKESFLAEFTVKAYDPSAVPVLAGDVYKDGKVDRTDASELLRHISGLSVSEEFDERAADYDGNGSKNLLDVIAILEAVGGGEQGGGEGSENINAAYSLVYSGAGTFDIFTVSGSAKSGIDSKEYGGVTYTTALKTNKEGKIEFSTGKAYNMTVILANSGSISVDGTKVTADSNGIYTAEIAAGSHTIAKGDGESYVYGVILTEIN